MIKKKQLEKNCLKELRAKEQINKTKKSRIVPKRRKTGPQNKHNGNPEHKIWWLRTKNNTKDAFVGKNSLVRR